MGGSVKNCLRQHQNSQISRLPIKSHWSICQSYFRYQLVYQFWFGLPKDLGSTTEPQSRSIWSNQGCGILIEGCGCSFKKWVHWIDSMKENILWKFYLHVKDDSLSGVVQMILRPETTIESCAHEPIFWFIPRHGIKTCMGCSEYGGVYMEVVTRSI